MLGKADSYLEQNPSRYLCLMDCHRYTEHTHSSFNITWGLSSSHNSLLRCFGLLLVADFLEYSESLTLVVLAIGAFLEGHWSGVIFSRCWCLRMDLMTQFHKLVRLPDVPSYKRCSQPYTWMMLKTGKSCYWSPKVNGVWGNQNSTRGLFHFWRETRGNTVTSTMKRTCKQRSN